MHTNNTETGTPIHNSQNPPGQTPGNTGWPSDANHAPAWAPTAAGPIFASKAGAIIVLLAVLVLLAALVTTVLWLVTGNPVQDTATALAPIRTITDPISDWLTLHTAGLPVTTGAVGCVWGATGAVVFYNSTRGHLTAQLLWPVYGAATAAMVWFGTAIEANRPVTVGLLAVTWALLSLRALPGRAAAVEFGTDPADQTT